MTKLDRERIESAIQMLQAVLKAEPPDETPVEVTITEPEDERPTDSMGGVTVSREDLLEKAEEAMRYCSVDAVRDLFVKHYGVPHVSAFKPEQYANVIDTLDDMIEASSKEPVDASDD